MSPTNSIITNNNPPANLNATNNDNVNKFTFTINSREIILLT